MRQREQASRLQEVCGAPLPGRGYRSRASTHTGQVPASKTGRKADTRQAEGSEGVQAAGAAGAGPVDQASHLSGGTDWVQNPTPELQRPSLLEAELLLSLAAKGGW